MIFRVALIGQCGAIVQKLGLWPHNKIVMRLWQDCGATNDCGGSVATTSIMSPSLFVRVGSRAQIAW